MQVIILLLLLLLLLLLCNHYRGGSRSDSPAALAMAGPLLGPAFNSHTYHIMYVHLTWLLKHVITNEMAELPLRMHYTTVAIPDARFFGSTSQSGSDSNSYG